MSSAGLTLGALYHHFPGKSAVFVAVHDQVDAEVADQVSVALTVSVTSGRDPLAVLCAVVDACVDAYTKPDARQILLVDGPAVLGLRQKRAHATIDVVATALQIAMSAGTPCREPPAVLAHLVVAAIEEAAGYLARWPGEEPLKGVKCALHCLVRSLSSAPDPALPHT